MKKVYSNILVLFSLFMIVFCMASCGSKTVFGTYVNDNNSNEYYTLKEDYTWESHKIVVLLLMLMGSLKLILPMMMVIVLVTR